MFLMKTTFRFFRTLLLFVILSQSVVAQLDYYPEIDRAEPIDDQLIGDWYLNQVDVVDGYNGFSDANRFTSGFDRNKKITFTNDSLYNYRDKTIRFYTRLEHYKYRLEFDTLMRRYDLNLFTGKKRKLREVESYEILHCSNNELIIKSNQHLTRGIDNVSLSVIYVYRRELVSELTQDLELGEWFCCTERGFLFSESDTSAYEFSRNSDEAECTDSYNHTYLTFKAVKYHNTVFWSEYAGVLGGGGLAKYSLDSQNELLYIRSARLFVYNVSIVNEKLTLSLNIEKTEEFRRISKKD